MKKLYKIMLAALFTFFSFIPFSLDSHAYYASDFSILSSAQVNYINYIYSVSSDYQNIVIYSVFDGSTTQLFFSSDFTYSNDIITTSSRIWVDPSGNQTFQPNSDSFNPSTEQYFEVYYFKYNGTDIHKVSLSPSLPEGIYFKVTRYIDNISSNVHDKITSISDTFTVPVHNVSVDAGLQCSSWQTSSNGSTYCYAWSLTRQPPYSSTYDPVISIPSYTVSGSSSLVYSEDTSYNYTVTTYTEIYFPQAYSGAISISNLDGVASDNAIVIDGVVYFNNTSKILITEKRSYVDRATVSIPSSSKEILGFSFWESPHGTIEVNDSQGNSLISNGNSSSQSASSSIDSVTTSFNSTASQYESFESQFNSNLTSSLQDINVSDINLGSISDFTKTAAFVKTQFDDILTSSGIYQTAISFVLIIGVALLLLGRRL